MKETEFLIVHGKVEGQIPTRIEVPEIESWSDFVQVVGNLHHYGNLRSEAMLARYAQIKQLIAKLGQDHTEVIVRQVKSTVTQHGVAIMPNAIPYDRLINPINQALASSGRRVGHYCIWNQAGPLTDQQVVEAVQIVFPNALDWCGYENEAAAKSVPSLWHMHLFVLQAPT